jgi:hypothetical protein
MPRKLKKRPWLSDDSLSWIATALVLVAAIVIDKGSPPHKWHAAIMWTAVSFFGVLVWGIEKGNLWSFWIFWAVCLGCHLLAMWLIFGRLVPRLILGTLLVYPIAFVESILLTGLFFALERKLGYGSAGSRKKRNMERF